MDKSVHTEYSLIFAVVLTVYPFTLIHAFTSGIQSIYLKKIYSAFLISGNL